MNEARKAAKERELMAIFSSGEHAGFEGPAP